MRNQLKEDVRDINWTADGLAAYGMPATAAELRMFARQYARMARALRFIAGTSYGYVEHREAAERALARFKRGSKT